MKERGPWRLWSTFLLVFAGNLCSSIVQSQSYDGARGDQGDGNSNLGFSDVVRRHDGYVKGETPTIPQTSFSCSATPHNPGLYADVETQCQVYHVCFEDRQESFLCGPGTNFNQRILACDFWYNFDCQDSPSFYGANADIGKVPETVFRPGQSREPAQPQPQRPSYPSFPQQPAQPPAGGSYPNRVSVPPPPPPRIPQDPIEHQPPRVDPQPPRVYPPAQQPPRVDPQPPRVYPPAQQPPRVYPPAQQPPRVYPPAQQPPRVYPPAQQPPRVYPPAQQPATPRPEPPHVSAQPGYPRVPQGSGQPTKVRPPPPQQLPPSQQEEDNGYQFDGYTPQRPVLPPPPPPHVHAPRPAFPPVISPPRVSRPPLTPAIIRQPEISRPRPPTIDTRSEYHPDSHLKGSVGYQPPRIPQPSRPVGSYPSYPVAQKPVHQTPISRPAEKPSRPVYQPPATVQQEHVDTEYVPPPPPPRPKEPSRPSTIYVPPPPPPRPKEPSRPSTTYVPPPPVQQEVTNIGFIPQQPSRPAYVPPPVVQKPVDNDYGRPQPPVAPSVIREQQKPAIQRPSGSHVSGGSRQPQPPPRPKPVFPPASDHPNSNIKGGPGYNQPPPNIPKFEPTRISRPSTPQGGYQQPPPPRPKPVSTTAVKPTVVKTPVTSGQGSYKPPQDRIKKPSDQPRTVYQPPIQVIDHPQAEIKGVAYDPSRQPQRVQSPSTPISGVKRPQQQVQRPRAPVVISRPQPPSLPTTSIKRTSPANSQVYEKPATNRVKLPSTSQVQTVSRPSQPRFPAYEDHPNANIKGGSGYVQPPLQPVSRPSGPPSSPSTSYEQKTTSSNPGRGSGSGYPSRGDGGSIQQIIHQEEYKPSRSSPPSSIKTVQKITAVKDTSSYPKPPSSSHHSVLINKQSKPDYEAGSSYTRGPETYPKPEFGKPHTPVSTPSRLSPSTKQGLPSQNTITRSQNKPAIQGPSVSTGSGARVGSGSDIRPDYPFNQIPGHQPPHHPQVFPHRENPDHPNESLKGSSAYRPPPPAGFQAAASDVHEQQVVPEPEPEPASSSLHGDTGSE